MQHSPVLYPSVTMVIEVLDTALADAIRDSKSVLWDTLLHSRDITLNTGVMEKIIWRAITQHV